MKKVELNTYIIYISKNIQMSNTIHKNTFKKIYRNVIEFPYSQEDNEVKKDMKFIYHFDKNNNLVCITSSNDNKVVLKIEKEYLKNRENYLCLTHTYYGLVYENDMYTIYIDEIPLNSINKLVVEYFNDGVLKKIFIDGEDEGVLYENFDEKELKELKSKLTSKLINNMHCVINENKHIKDELGLVKISGFCDGEGKIVLLSLHFATEDGGYTIEKDLLNVDHKTIMLNKKIFQFLLRNESEKKMSIGVEFFESVLKDFHIYLQEFEWIKNFNLIKRFRVGEMQYNK